MEFVDDATVHPIFMEFLGVDDSVELLDWIHSLTDIGMACKEISALKEEGNLFFFRYKFGSAVNSYRKAVKIMLLSGHEIDSSGDEFRALSFEVYSNLAACQFILKNFRLAWCLSRILLDIDKLDVKALCGYAESLFQLQQYKEALNCVNNLLLIQPYNQEVISGIATIQAHIRKQKGKGIMEDNSASDFDLSKVSRFDDWRDYEEEFKRRVKVQKFSGYLFSDVTRLVGIFHNNGSVNEDKTEQDQSPDVNLCDENHGKYVFRGTSNSHRGDMIDMLNKVRKLSFYNKRFKSLISVRLLDLSCHKDKQSEPFDHNPSHQEQKLNTTTSETMQVDSSPAIGSQLSENLTSWIYILLCRYIFLRSWISLLVVAIIGKTLRGLETDIKTRVPLSLI